ncbi:hypothetical protein LTR16_011173 [Cryomyces antarcticus]|uniref:Uncharacterized protein n=1 Tax=Cryomyces antarcticus TaxID=329879 RepID=A0ABR0LSF4_9PEZI|nr:hypothetical protein LTR16_011173 [Cryomyces antarcticus]
MDSRRGSIGSVAPSSSSSDLYRSTGSVQEKLSPKDDVEDLPLMKRELDSVDPEGSERLARSRFDEQELPQTTKRELENDDSDESVEAKRRKVEQPPDDIMTASAPTTAGLPAEVWQSIKLSGVILRTFNLVLARIQPIGFTLSNPRRSGQLQDG